MFGQDEEEQRYGLWVAFGAIFLVIGLVLAIAVGKLGQGGSKAKPVAKAAMPAAASAVTAAAASTTPAAQAVRGPKPVSLYFDTAKFDAPIGAGKELEALIAYAASNPNAKLALSGFHDSKGNAAANAELAKNRAKSVREVLKAAGLAEDRMMMEKPTQVDGGTDDRESRRVDVYVKQ
jgi:outer membrane protein OmpA-like peptidoglycan-associated protein